MLMRGPFVGATLFGVFGLPLGFVSPVHAQSLGPELGAIYVWVGIAIGLALLIALGVEAILARARSRQMSLLLSCLPSAVIELDRSGMVQFLNNLARQWLDKGTASPPFPWPPDVKLNKGGDSGPSHPKGTAMKRILEGPGITREHHILAGPEPQSADRHVRVTATPVDRGNKEHIVLVLDEMLEEGSREPKTKRHRSEDLLANMAQGIANDFNNALATIAYAIDLSLKQALPEKAASLLMTALTTIERGQQTTEKMQMLTGDTDKAASNLSVLGMLEDLRTSVQDTLEAHIDVTLECDEPGLIVRCDRERLEETLLALVENAHYAKRDVTGSAHITLSARALKMGERVEQLRDLFGTSFDYVEISVAESLADESSNPLEGSKAKGIGKALIAAREFVTDARGDMQVQIHEGRGTKVSLFLPAEPLHVRRSQTDVPFELRGKGETVFLVEDEPLFLLMLQEELEELGYRVISATSGKAAIGLIEQGVEFDIVIADVVMPGDINGFDLANKIRKLRHRAAVLYMSGYSGFTPEDMGEAKAPILKKPCPPNELARAVQSALKERMM